MLTRLAAATITFAGGGGWRSSHGASAAVTQASLAAAARYSAQRRGHALLVIHQGKVIHESYGNGAKRADAQRIYSGTKGFWGLAALAAVEDGLLSLDEPVSAAISEWRTDAAKARIKVRQLLNFTCGLERCLKLHEDGLKNRNAMAIARPLVAAPGQAFIYGPSALQVFHEVLKRKLDGAKRRETPVRYLERRVLRPLGLGPQRYLPDQAGNPLLAAGFVMTAQQWSKMGLCLLREGQPVISPATFTEVRRGSEPNGAYNLGFWNNRAASRFGREVDIEDMLDLDWQRQNWSRACISRSAPADLLACIGSGYQRLFAVPSLDLAVVRQGQNARFNDAAFLSLVLGRG